MFILRSWAGGPRPRHLLAPSHHYASCQNHHHHHEYDDDDDDDEDDDDDYDDEDDDDYNDEDYDDDDDEDTPQHQWKMINVTLPWLEKDLHLLCSFDSCFNHDELMNCCNLLIIDKHPAQCPFSSICWKSV